jgi:hypothetical protein
LRQHAQHCAREGTPQDQRKDVVEPDHSCGSGPHKITDDAVVAVSNPATLCERPSCERAKLLGWPRDPVRLPKRASRFNVRKTQRACRDRAKGGFPTQLVPIQTTRAISVFIRSSGDQFLCVARVNSPLNLTT